jgi:hypothetical protein
MYKRINLYLDDIRLPSMSHNNKKGLGENFSDTKEWKIVRDYFEFINVVEKEFDKIKLISLDHDLACYDDNNSELTGKSAADFLINYCIENNKKIPDWYVHSDNTTGKSNIKSVMLSYMSFVENIDISSIRYYHNGFVDGRFV